MHDHGSARRLLEQHLASMHYPYELEITTMGESTFAWVFSWNTREWVEACRRGDADLNRHTCLVGQGPYFVDKVDGAVRDFGSAVVGRYRDLMREYDRLRENGVTGTELDKESRTFAAALARESA